MSAGFATRSVTRKSSRVRLGLIVGVAVLAATGAFFVGNLSSRAPTDSGSMRLVAAAPTAVNPYAHYTSEPAPVGITDFGVGANDVPYEYNTSAWLDSASFTSLDVNGTSLGEGVSQFFPAGGLGVTLQQNVVLEFEDGGASYYWWVQNVAGLTPGGCPAGTTPVFANGQWEILVGSCPGNPGGPNHDTMSYIYFVDNVWNFSASGVEGAPIYPTSIQGNGLVYGTLVYADAAGDLAGNQVNLSFPAVVQLKVAATSVAGEPEVAFEYDDGYGWQTYDVVRFPFVSELTGGNHFQVNGYSLNPEGLYTDAELDLGGFGDGTYSALNHTAVAFSEEYWNGHDYQAPPSTFNFGSDTAESVDFANVSASLDSNTGAVGASIVNSTATGLSSLYTNAQLGTLVVHAPFSSGDLKYGGQRHDFSNREYVQTLAPGRYTLKLYHDGKLVWTEKVTVTAGGTTTETA
jgi:hypothetical protein